MPYRTNQELPDSVKDNLPSHAQDIYREAFDSAWDEFKIRPSDVATNRSKRSPIKWPGPRLSRNTRR
jgi:cation transport regulator